MKAAMTFIMVGMVILFLGGIIWALTQFLGVDFQEPHSITTAGGVISHIQCGIDEIRRYLLLLPAAGGWGLALAATIETGIIVPSGLGVSKNTEEEVKRAVKRKEEEDADRKKD